MKILMITPYLPYPLLSGGQARSYNLLKNIAQDHQITLFCFIREKDEKKYIADLAKFCSKIVVFKRRPAWSPINIFLSTISFYPFLVSIYLSRGFRKALDLELKKGNYDLIHAETFYVMPNIPKTKLPVLLVEQTIEYQVYQHFVEQFKFSFLRPLLWIDVFKVKYWESFFWKKAKKVIAMSKEDKNKMLKVLPSLDVEIVPNGVDVEFFSESKKKEGKKPTVLYIGNFKWLQNREAILILIQKIWPQIKKEIKNAQLLVIGQGLTKKIKSFASPEIIFDERCEDIRQAYNQATLLLAPIKGPGGTRLKILEAMASNCPVVTTPVGAEGIEAEDKKEILVRKSHQGLAKAAIEIIKDNVLKERLVKNAKALVLKKYNWQKISKQLNRIYNQLGDEKTI